MYDKCYFCLDQLPKLKKESTASFFVNFGGAGVQKSRPTLLYLCGAADVGVLESQCLDKKFIKPISTGRNHHHMIG